MTEVKKTLDHGVEWLRELRAQYAKHHDFCRCLKMDPETSDSLLSMVLTNIERQDTNYRNSISAEERLAIITLRYFA
jgi:hypothetical protein